jgi:hypothetical protein
MSLLYNVFAVRPLSDRQALSYDAPLLGLWNFSTASPANIPTSGAVLPHPPNVNSS